jgi:fucose permease
MRAPSLFLLVLTYLGFVSLGLPDTITGVVWPSVAKHFALPLGYLGTVLVASVSGYLVSSLSAGTAIQRLGVGGLLSASGALVAVSLAGFGLAPSFGWFLAAAVISGLGAGAIDGGLNAYAARHFSARQMTWLHGFWGVGATLGAMAAASVLAAGLAWQATYGILGVAIVLLTVTFFLNRQAWQDGGSKLGEEARHETPGTVGEALRHPVVWAQMLAFYIYTGVEATAGSWGFTLLSQYREVSVGLAGTAVTCYWGALTVGRFLLGAIANHVGVYRLLGLGAATMALGGLTFVLAPWTWLAMVGMALLGFSLAPIFPGLMSQTPMRLGRLADHAVGFQVGAAMLGAVSMPGLGGILLEQFGIRWLNGMIGVLVVSLGLIIGGLVWSARLVREPHADHRQPGPG